MGTNYSGWQIQPNGKTIQGVIESKLEIIFKEKVSLIAAGRTDAGVHALGQTAHIKTHNFILPGSLKCALNSMLPADISIISTEEVNCDFHARFMAKKKQYRYFIYRGEKSPFYWPYTWFYKKSLDIEAIKEALTFFRGTHDFSAFSVQDRDTIGNSIRIINQLELFQYDNPLLCFQFEGNGFLRKMVRRIVCTLLNVGRGRFNLNDIKQMFDSKDPQTAGQTAPAQGLFLIKIYY